MKRPIRKFSSFLGGGNNSKVPAFEWNTLPPILPDIQWRILEEEEEKDAGVFLALHKRRID